MAEVANANVGQGDLNVPRCVEGIKAAFAEFLNVLEAVLQAEEKHMSYERERVLDKQQEAEAWCRKSSEQFFAWKAAADRVEKWYSMVQEVNGAAAGYESPRSPRKLAYDEPNIPAQSLLTGASGDSARAREQTPERDALSIANNIASMLRVDAVAAALDDRDIRIPYGPAADEPRLLQPLAHSNGQAQSAVDLAGQLSSTAKPKLGIGRTPVANGDLQSAERDPDVPKIPVITNSAPELIVSRAPCNELVPSELRAGAGDDRFQILEQRSTTVEAREISNSLENTTFLQLVEAVADGTGVEVTTLPEVQTHTV